MATRKLTGRRRPDRAQNIEQYWASRRMRAQTPTRQLAVEWDRFRVALDRAVARLDPNDAADLLATITSQVVAMRQQIDATTDSKIHGSNSRPDSRL
jgi:hypothetical protein